MEQEQDKEVSPDPAFVQGMNEGYYLAKFMPEVADGLYKIVSDSERMQGFKAGREEYMKEMIAERMKSWEKEEPQWRTEIDKEKEIDREQMDKNLDHEME